MPITAPDSDTGSGLAPSYLFLPEPAPVERIGPWEGVAEKFSGVLGWTVFGHVLLIAPDRSEYGLLHPLRGAFRSYGVHASVADFERDVLQEWTFRTFTLRPGHQRAVQQLLGPPGPEQVYVPRPYPMLGGDESPGSYHLGDVWLFLDLVARLFRANI
jgi:hypothetical protein